MLPNFYLLEGDMLNKILVTMDSSDGGESVFRQGLELAQATNASLMILHVLTPEEQGYPEPPFIPSAPCALGASDMSLETYRQELDQLRTQGLERLKILVHKAKLLNVSADYAQTSGNPGPVICDLAKSWEADVILMGSQERNGLSKLLPGSVSKYVIRHAPCAVLMLRSPSKEQPLPKFAPPTYSAQTVSHFAGWQ